MKLIKRPKQHVPLTLSPSDVEFNKYKEECEREIAEAIGGIPPNKLEGKNNLSSIQVTNAKEKRKKKK